MSTWGLIVTLVLPWLVSNQATSISLSKCPILQTIVLSFIDSKWLPTIISLLPVVVTTILAFFIALSIFFTANPSIAAWRAHIGSISVTITLAPAPFKEAADPLPTSP